MPCTETLEVTDADTGFIQKYLQSSYCVLHTVGAMRQGLYTFSAPVHKAGEDTLTGQALSDGDHC